MPCTVILTALTVEYKAIRSYLTDLQDDETPEGVIYERGKFAANGKIWEIGIAEVGVGNIKATRETQRAISHFNPDILFFVGIAGGIKDVNIGDVVVAEDVIYYESGKITEPDVFQSRPKTGKSAFTLVERARNVARRGDWLQRLASITAPAPEVKVAPIVAGEIVLTSRESDIFKLIRGNYNDAIAVEMEGYGFLSAAFAYPNIKSIVIRGISDLVAGKNDDSVEPEEERQAKASHHACAFALELLTKFDPEAGARDPIMKDGVEWTKNASASASGQGAISIAGSVQNSILKTVINNIYDPTQPRTHDPIPQPNLNFLGREEAIKDIKKIADRLKKIIVVYADGGVGKTTLAENFFELDKSYKKLLKVDDISEDGTTTAEEVLNKLLAKVGIDVSTRSLEFKGNLNLLEQKLIESGSKIGLLIDNEVNKKVANLYNEDAKDPYKDESHRIDAAFEAFDHYYEAQEFEECHSILLQILEADKEIENLRCSQNLWQYMDKVVNKCEKLRKTKSDRLSNLSKAITLIPLGVLYSEVGKTHEAVEVRNDILTAIKNIDSSEKKIFAEVSAYLISARSRRIIGNLKLAELDSEEAIQLVDKYHREHIISDNKMCSLKSLSVYERGNVHLEKAKSTDSSKEAQKALSCFTRAAYLALNEKKVPNQAYILLIISVIYSSTKKFQSFVQALITKILSKKRSKARKTNEVKNKDYTKYFRVLFNAAQCLKLMKYTPFDYLFLIEAKRRLPETDDLNNAWVYLELALHSSKRKNYELALSLRDKGNLEALCSTSVLFNYGNFMYESEEYIKAMNKYLELKDFLDLNKIGFESLRCHNYQRICLTWLRLKENGEEKCFPNLSDAKISKLSKHVCINL